MGRYMSEFYPFLSRFILHDLNDLYIYIDRTISDSFKLGFTSTAKVLERNGKPGISEDEYHQGTVYTTPRRFAWHITGNPDDQIGELLGQQFDDLYVKLVSTESAPLYDGIYKLLEKLHGRGLILGALSNACGAYVKAVLKENDLDSLFRVGLGADDVPRPKPFADGLVQLCTELGVSAASSVYVGDSPTDGQAATAAGMKSIGVTWGSHPKASVIANFDYCVDSVEELDFLLESICFS